MAGAMDVPPLVVLAGGCIATPVFAVAHWLADGVYLRVATALGCPQHPPGKRQQCAQQIRELLCYAVLLVAGLGVVPGHGIITDGRRCWESLSVPVDIGVYYALQIASYLSIMLTDVADRRRGDGRTPLDALSWVHHAITLTLVIGSLLPGYVRVGAKIFLAHDPSSLALKASRALYLAGHGAARPAFAAFAAAFFLCRILWFPSIVIFDAVMHSRPAVSPSGFWVLNSLLVLLVLLNMFWMVKIGKVIARPPKPETVRRPPAGVEIGPLSAGNWETLDDDAAPKTAPAAAGGAAAARAAPAADAAAAYTAVGEDGGGGASPHRSPGSHPSPTSDSSPHLVRE